MFRIGEKVDDILVNVTKHLTRGSQEIFWIKETYKAEMIRMDN